MHFQLLLLHQLMESTAHPQLHLLTEQVTDLQHEKMATTLLARLSQGLKFRTWTPPDPFLTWAAAVLVADG